MATGADNLNPDPTAQVAPLSELLPPALPDPAVDPNAPIYNFANGTPYLYNRNWALNVLVGTSTLRSYKGLRISFELTKTASAQLNQGKIAVYNFSDDSRELFKPQNRLDLLVGYGDLLSPILSFGNIFRVTHERKGPDIVTTLEISESGAAITTSVLNKTYPAGTPPLQVVNDLISAQGFILGTVDSGFLNKPFNSAQTFSGRCINLLQDLAKANGCEVAPPKDNVINITGTSSTVTPIEIPLSEKSGLVGVPNFTPAGQGNDGTVTFTALIDPRLQPGAIVRITSRFITSPIAIEKATFEGDTHDSKWTVKCEGSTIKSKA